MWGKPGGFFVEKFWGQIFPFTLLGVDPQIFANIFKKKNLFLFVKKPLFSLFLFLHFSKN